MKMGSLSILVLLTTTCFGQVDTTSIYSVALKQYNTQLDNLKSETTEIFVESNSGITEKLPGNIGNRRVTILTSQNQKDIYVKHDNKLKHVKIFPARTKDDLIEVNLIPYFGEYKGKRKGYFLAVSDWVTIQFKFDCSDNKFKYWNTKLGGV